MTTWAAVAVNLLATDGDNAVSGFEVEVDAIARDSRAPWLALPRTEKYDHR